MNDYLRSRGLSGPAWEAAKAVGSGVYDVVVETPKDIKESVIDPIGDGIEDVVSFSVDDIVPGGMDDAIDGVVTGSWQDKWDKITG